VAVVPAQILRQTFTLAVAVQVELPNKLFI
jgi:hypothetical protein